MLLASLSVSGVLNADADDKTGDGLAAYAMTAYNEGWRYVWGGASYGAVDCSGLIYSYVGGGARVTEDMLYSSPESGYVSNGVPDIPGLGLWQPGHVGVYVGGGMAVDARDEISNVCYQSVSTKNWVMWFKVAGVSYGTNTSVANSDQSKTDGNSDSASKPAQQTSKDETLSLGSAGKDVNALQERLKTLGYFTDNTTEYFGYVTKGALEDFQRAAGLSVTGVYDAKTKSALEAADAPAKEAPAPEVIEEVSDSEPEILFDTEEPSEDDSGYAEPETDTAEKDGEQITLGSDMSEDEAQTDEESDPEADDTEKRFALEDEEVDPEQSSANGEGETDASPADAVYELGDEDAEISDIQYILIKLGYFDYNITGTFCTNTADAVEAFRCDYELGDERYIDEATLEAVYGVYNGTYGSALAAKAPLYESIAADTDSAQPEQTAEDSEDSIDSSSQSVTVTVSETAESTAQEQAPAQDNASDDKAAGTTEKSSEKTSAGAVSAQAAAPQTSTENVVFVQTGAEDYFSRSLVLIVIGISCIVIFFAGTIHYWNVSMEKRRQRARRASTVSVYRRSSM